MAKPYLTDAQIKQECNKLFSALQSELVDKPVTIDIEKKDELGQERILKGQTTQVNARVFIHDTESNKDFTLSCLGKSYTANEMDELAKEIVEYSYY